MDETVSCAECSTTIPRQDAVAGVSPHGWICRTCFAKRDEAERGVVRRVRRRGVVMAVLGLVIFVLGVFAVVGVSCVLPEVGADDGLGGRGELRGSVELFVFVVSIAVAGLALALTGLFKARRRSRYAGIVPGAGR